MPEAPPRTAIDDLLDQFVEALRPAHERHAAVPATAITVRKSELRDAAANLLLAHEHYLVGAAPVLSAALSREEVEALINRPGQIVRLSPDLMRMHATDPPPPAPPPPADPRPAPQLPDAQGGSDHA